MNSKSIKKKKSYDWLKRKGRGNFIFNHKFICYVFNVLLWNI